MPNFKSALRAFLLFLFLGVFTVLSPCSWAEGEPVAGKNYVVLDNPVKTAAPDKVEVIEFFWYGCPHCYHLEPYIESWLKQKPAFVDFKYVPAAFSNIWDVHARAFYTAETMNVLDQTHKATFNAIHQAKKNLISLDQIKDFYQTLGVDGDKFKKTATSFIVDVRMKQAKDLAQAYHLESVPVLAVNGKYLVSPSMNANQAKTIEALNYLVAKEKALLPN